MGKSLIITTGGGTDIEEGSPNARPDVILQGYSLFVGPNDDPVIGSMPTQYATPTTYTMGVGSSLTLAKGYYTGGLTCSAKPLKDFTSATATADQITNAKTGWRNGAKQTGSMPWIGAGGATLSANGTHTISKGQYDGKGKVAQSLSTQAATNITPGTAQKTVIAANKWTTGAQTVLGNANLIAGNIKKNVTIFGVVGTWIVDSRDLASGVYLVQNGEIGLNGTINRNGDTYDWEINKSGLNASILANLRNQCVAPYREGNCLVFTTMHWDMNSGSGTNSNYEAYISWTLHYKHHTAIDGKRHWLAMDVDKITWSIAHNANGTACNYFGAIIRSDRKYWIANKYSNCAAGNNFLTHSWVASAWRSFGISTNPDLYIGSCVKGVAGGGYTAKAKSGVSYDPNDCYAEITFTVLQDRAAQYNNNDWAYGSKHGTILKLWLRNLWEHL